MKDAGKEPCYVLVADDGRARLFSIETTKAPGRGVVQELVERESLVDPTARMAGRDLSREPTTGRGKGGPTHGAGQQTLDDRREHRSQEARRRHARNVAEALKDALGSDGAPERLLLAASPKMLGALRPEIERLLTTGVEIVERPQDLTRLSAHELHEHLVRDGLLPPRPPYQPPGA